MPLQDYMHLISVDDHLIEPPDVWSTRLPKKFLDEGPRIIEMDMSQQQGDEGLSAALLNAARGEGGRAAKKKIAEVWSYEGRIYPNIGLNAVAGKKPQEYGMDPTRYSDMLPGCYDAKARVADMDIDGVQAALCFPSFPRFAGTVFLEGEDKELALLSVKAWNDFHLDEWAAAAPDRIIPLIILPLWDPQAAAEEIYRCAAKGAKAITFPENTVTLGLPSFYTDHWDPVFRAAEETNMPLCMHFGSSGRAPITSPEAPMAVMIALFGTNSMYATADLLFSPVFYKFPNLKIALSEGGIGWMPYLLERIDLTWEKHRWYQNVNKEVRPSDLFRSNIYGCFIDDHEGVARRHQVGIDNITWECDYPHSDSNWPNSRRYTEKLLAEVPDEEAHKIVELNARKLYNFPRTEAAAR
ncbi:MULTISPECIES: amidohydrolase family protein [Gordonia]|uniref:Amidohydrolase n=1 Tax=Gordonia hongkongensis TaxID=1701090 RepID=A0ABT6BWI9_9ACTN|nr:MULTISPECIES: amidohydrolase family protein [Gordonia]MCT1351972.1 amidohydrolase [Gordonia sp. p3-SID1431]MDF6102378.1 amidohydrolase [Gordonia hongkongensis]UPG67778.1 amidohydrolase [Gordonia hongkongensis]WGJ85092.1 amidohydrolase family protein [Gordonia sp. SMJS1]